MPSLVVRLYCLRLRLARPGLARLGLTWPGLTRRGASSQPQICDLLGGVGGAQQGGWQERVEARQWAQHNGLVVSAGAATKAFGEAGTQVKVVVLGSEKHLEIMQAQTKRFPKR